jgi:integrase
MGQTAEPRWYESRQGWYVWRGPKLVCLAKGKDSKGEAWARFNRLLLDEGRPVPASDWTVQALADVFLEHCHKNLAPLTAEWYARHLQSFVMFAGRTRADEVKPYTVALWLDSHEWARSTRHGATTAVKRLYSWARKQGYLDANPIEGVAKPGIDSRSRPFTTIQLDAILAVTDQALGDLLIVLRETGMRPSEGMRMTAAELQLTQDQIVLPRGMTKRPRVVYLTERAKVVLARLAVENPKGPIFLNAGGTAWTRHLLSHRFARLRKRLGAEFGREIAAGGLRHGFATDALLAEVPIATVAELLGHTSTAMVEKHYSHLRENRGYLKRAVKRVRPESPE